MSVSTCRVQRDGGEVLLHELHALEWTDSPEYVARQTPRGATFQVRIRALPAIALSVSDYPAAESIAAASTSLTVFAEACRVLVLPYAGLERVYGRLPHVRGVIDCVVARDVTHKLFATGEAIRGAQKLSATIDEQSQQAATAQQQKLENEEERKEGKG